MPSEKELEISKLGREYRSLFGEAYPLGPGEPTIKFTDDELIADMRRCIDEGKPREPRSLREEVLAGKLY